MNMNPYQVGQATQNMANGNPGLMAAQQQQQQQMMADALRNQQIEPMNTTSAIPGYGSSSQVPGYNSQPQGGGGGGMPDLSKLAQMAQQGSGGVQSLNTQTQGGAGPVAWNQGVTDGSGLPSWLPSMSDVGSLFGLSDGSSGAAAAADAIPAAASSDSLLASLPEIAMMFA